MGKKTIVSVTYENERISIKKQLTLLKMCVTSPLCGPRADLWPFYGFLCKRFSFYIKVYHGWALQRSGPTDPPKENGHKFAPTVPIASKFRLGNTRQCPFPFVILLQDAFALTANQMSQISATFPVWSRGQSLGLNSTLPLKDSDTAWDSNYSHSGWQSLLLPLTSIPEKENNGSKRLSPTPSVSNLSLRPCRYLSIHELSHLTSLYFALIVLFLIYFFSRPFYFFSFFFYCCSLILNSLLVGSVKCHTSQPLNPWWAWGIETLLSGDQYKDCKGFILRPLVMVLITKERLSHQTLSYCSLFLCLLNQQ